MATSGVINGSVSQRSSWFQSHIYWRRIEVDEENNRSRVTVEVLVSAGSSGYTWNGTVSDLKVTINGSTYSRGSFNSNTTSGWTYSTSSSPISNRVAEIIYSRTVWVGHKTDGSKSFSMSASFKLPSGGYGPGNVSISGSGTLNSIPRASVPTLSNSSRNYGQSVTIYTNRASTAFTHTIRYNWNGRTGTIATGINNSTSWTIPNSFMNYIPNSTSTTGTIYLDTFKGSTKIGTKSVTLKTNVPTSVTPSIGTISVSEYKQSVRDFIGSSTGPYIRGISRLSISTSGISGTYGSSIKSRQTTFNGTTYSWSSGTTNTIKNSGTLTITVKVTDSRGRSETKSTTVTVLAYNPPKITAFRVERCDADGTRNELGTYARVTRAGTWNSLDSRNSVSIVIKTRPRTSTSWTTKDTADGGTGGSFSGDIILGTYSEILSYDFRLEFKDQFNTTVSLVALPTGQVTMSWGTSGVGIGKVHERGALDVYGQIFSNGGEVPYIEESGSNSNGKYVRYSNGIQLCYQEVGSADFGATDMSSGNIWRSSTNRWYFPAEFINSADVVSWAGISTYLRWVNVYVLNNNYATVVMWSSIESTASYNLELMAVGRWK